MKRHDFPDLGKLMDEIFSAAEDFTSAFTDRMQFSPDEKAWKWNREYYSAHPFPSANIFMTKGKTLIFEFAIAGFGVPGIHGNIVAGGDTLPVGRPRDGMHGTALTR